jgi:hypothetical protein
MSNRRSLFEKISKLNYDLEIYAEISGHGVDKSFFSTLKKVGVKEIQIGIEAFSKNILHILNKGVDVMRNVEMLKWCAEFNISVFYNLIYGVPGETEADIKETLENIRFLKYFQPPARLCEFTLSYGSTAFINMQSFGIKKYKLPDEFYLNYPSGVAERLGILLSPIVGYDLDHQPHLEAWKKVYEEILKWRKNWEMNGRKPGIYFQRGEGYLIITLLDDGREKRIRINDETLTKIYLECLDERKSIFKLSQKFGIDIEQLQESLRTLAKNGIMFEYENYYFSLALPVRKS